MTYKVVFYGMALAPRFVLDSEFSNIDFAVNIAKQAVRHLSDSYFEFAVYENDEDQKIVKCVKFSKEFCYDA